ncbi:magnesium and cobalt transport protein CorA [Glycomyces harbinensis]|uniref:Magnesium transporter n=1 Tax=Glycomyces harbinensis TaxID=58114 RepID=A0A1G6U7E7_9ACTN|nr:magnesium and cobalt transport protein CorA [Glycomyces harbinensis]SDD37144.1 magnesium transporter [Glycomyces harbinensis]
MFDYMVVGPAGVEHRRGEGADLPAAAGADSFVWAAFDEPGLPDLVAALEALGLDHLGVDPGRTVHRRPKVELTEDAVMLLVKTVWYLEDTRQVETGDLALYTDGRALVTVRRGVVDPAEGVRKRLGEADFRSEGVPGIVQALFDAVVEEYDGAIEDLADDVSDLEQAVFSGLRVDRNEDIYFLIRETLEFQNAVQPLVPLAHMIKERRTGQAALQGGRMQDVAGHLIRIDGAIETCMSLLTTVLTAHQGQIGTWQNDDMRRISAWAAIAVVPTAVAGIYGMNFTHMPELHWRVGYPAVMLFIGVVCFLLYRGFKRNGWLLHIDDDESQWEMRERSEGRNRDAVPALWPCLPSRTP